MPADTILLLDAVDERSNRFVGSVEDVIPDGDSSIFYVEIEIVVIEDVLDVQIPELISDDLAPDAAYGVFIQDATQRIFAKVAEPLCMHLRGLT